MCVCVFIYSSKICNDGISDTRVGGKEMNSEGSKYILQFSNNFNYIRLTLLGVKLDYAVNLYIIHLVFMLLFIPLKYWSAY